ncbi:MAG: hypothetical protein RR250_06550 [Akkermansia sp.]
MTISLLDFPIFTVNEEDIPILNVRAKEWKVSLQDVSVAHLAKKHGGILLSGDKRLRTKSAESGIEIKGILWILDMIVERKLLIRKPQTEHLPNEQ